MQIAVEAFFYRKVVVVPWNIVAYNVFSGAGKGPNIFGTEPADFYIRNLALNFNVWALLALCAGWINALHYYFVTKDPYQLLKSSILLVPFYMWWAIFTLQPHKEERFMYPAYPFLALNAALTLHNMLNWIGNSDPKRLMGKIPAKLKLAVVGVSMLATVNLGVLRTVAMVTAYRAPLQVYPALAGQADIGPQTNLCVGKEWYRFPSSFFLPKGVRAKFITSEFNGLIPGEFSEAGLNAGLFPNTHMIPPGMNDENIADPSKYVSAFEYRV